MKRTWMFWVGWVLLMVALWYMDDSWNTWGVLGVGLMVLGLEERKR